MKRLYFILSAAILLGTTRPIASAALEVSVDFFHDHLEPYGDWREVGDYGYCWQPRDVDDDWRPYSDGHWVYTDAGWTWDSDEPYSWAVYHYGRWARIDQVGWVWVPGTEWGPAWVSWRRGSRHVGWAPLPPEARFSRSSGFNARVDFDFDIGPMSYSFVEVRNFGAPRLREVFVEPRQNITIINQTTNITHITYVNNVVYNEGPQYDVISHESAQPIRRLKLDRRVQLDGDPRAVSADQLKTRVEGDSMRVVAVPFDAKPAAAPRKVAAKVEKAEVNRGWKDAGPPDEVAKLRTKIKSEPTTPARPVAPATPPVVDEKPARGKVKNGDQPARPAPPVATESVPPMPEKGSPPDQRPKPAKPATAEKPAKPARPEPPVGAESAPPMREKGPAPDQRPKHAKPAIGEKPVKPEAANPRPSSPVVERTAPPSPSPRKGKIKGSESPRPPAEAPRPTQVHERKPQNENIKPQRTPPPPAVANPQPRPQARKPEARPQPAPPAAQPQPAQPAKGKGKDKDGKKDGTKPDGGSQ